MICARARTSSVRYGLALSRIKNVHSGCAWRFFTFWRVLLSDSLIVASSSNKNQSAVTCGYPSGPIVASMATSALRRSWCDSGKGVIGVLLLQRTITASASKYNAKRCHSSNNLARGAEWVCYDSFTQGNSSARFFVPSQPLEKDTLRINCSQDSIICLTSLFANSNE